MVIPEKYKGILIIILAFTLVVNSHGGDSITRGLQRPIGGDCQINKIQNKLKSMQKSNKFKASLSSFEEIRMLDVKLN